MTSYKFPQGAWLALPIAAALIVAGCGGGSTEIDPAKAESVVSGAVKNGGVTTVKSVSCPSGVKPKQGGTFSCDLVLASGESATATVHMIGDGGTTLEAKTSDFHIKQ